MKFVLVDGTETVCDVDEKQKISPHFTIKEVANNKAKDEIKYVSTPRTRKFLRMIEKMREKFAPNTGITCTSNYRTKSFNNATPHADPNSRHLYGEAMDWYIGNVPASMRKQVADYWQYLCILNREVGAINYYTHGFHLEIGSDLSYKATTFSIRDYRGTASDW